MAAATVGATGAAYREPAREVEENAMLVMLLMKWGRVTPSPYERERNLGGTETQGARRCAPPGAP